MKKLLSVILLGFLISFASCKPKENNETLWTIAWSPDAKYLATGGDHDELKIFETKTFKLIKTFPVKGVQLSRIKWHPTKNMLAVITQSKTFKAKILHIEEGKWTDLEGLKSGFRALDWNSDGNLLAVSELEDSVSIFSANGAFVSRFKADPKGVAGLDWHPFGDILVTVGTHIGVYTKNGDTLNTFQPRTVETFMLCVEWHPSGDFFAIGDYGDLENAENKLVQFWNSEGKKLNEIHGSLAEYRNIRWNHSGEKLATASDALRIWSKEAKPIAESKSTDDYLWGVDWSPDGKFIVTSSSEGKIAIWNENAKLVRELEE
ncbi:WD40 repeat domain-containing protein [Allomuricauda sp. SCSIO 65647]|uniref:WD40 repeat domain-containing protein n=1 Tax=Allomuricauda sp. SCSIO 65647 TaxID=2908843 RepID=UPI001F464E83|nr:hypothetical protein [Muricauda sp. SCSIO 65647]UJH68978.1 hypothetical protein L0P89_07120 [Muricauda sp. SCSIO 65647]